MIITFIGHSVISNKDEVKIMIKKIVADNASQDEPITCYLGGYGDFDEVCAQAVTELKKTHQDITRIYVTPYIGLREQEKIKDLQAQKLYDGYIYPPLENVPKRFAIVKRNEWMVSSADLIVSYVKRHGGNSYKALSIGKRKSKKIVNVCDFLPNG